MTPILENIMFRIAVALAFTSSAIGAQSLADAPTVLDAAVGQGSGVTSLSAMASRAIHIGSSGRVTVGLGARLTVLAVRGARMSAADPQGFAPPPDSLVVDGNGLTLNIGINAGFKINSRLHAGVNLDVFGFGGGPGGVSSYHRTPTSTAEPTSSRLASPNLFSGGSGDRGSLNSEFFLARTINDRYTVRGGLSHQLIEFAVSVENIESSASRFRRFANLAFIGVRVSTGQ